MNRKLNKIKINQNAKNDQDNSTSNFVMPITKQIPLKYTCMSCGKEFDKAQVLGQHSRHCIPSNKTAKNHNPDEYPWKCKDCNFR